MVKRVISRNYGAFQKLGTSAKCPKSPQLSNPMFLNVAAVSALLTHYVVRAFESPAADVDNHNETFCPGYQTRVPDDANTISHCIPYYAVVLLQEIHFHIACDVRTGGIPEDFPSATFLSLSLSCTSKDTPGVE